MSLSDGAGGYIATQRFPSTAVDDRSTLHSAMREWRSD